MDLIETIVSALAPLSLDHGKNVVGYFDGGATLDHYVVVPDYDESVDADNDEYIAFSHANIEFYIAGDYRPKIASAKTYLKTAGIAVLESKYVEYDEAVKKHHHYISVNG